MGFERMGTLRSTGFKPGRWVDTVMMQRPLGGGEETLRRRRSGGHPPMSPGCTLPGGRGGVPRIYIAGGSRGRAEQFTLDI